MCEVFNFGFRLLYILELILDVSVEYGSFTILCSVSLIIITKTVILWRHFLKKYHCMYVV